jgi:antitoxin component YwqK of YwqJK toxin-antitoxin module
MALQISDLISRNGLYYEEGADAPFTGVLDEGDERGAIKNGKREGHWRLYAYCDPLEAEGWGFPDSNHVDGWHIGSEGKFRNGRKKGTWVEYNQESGVVLSRGEYEGEDRVGHWTYYWANGQVREAGMYVHEEKAGPPHMKQFGSGSFNVIWGKPSRSKRTGLWLVYHEDGTRAGDYLGSEYEKLDPVWDSIMELLAEPVTDPTAETKVSAQPTVTDQAASLIALHPLAKIGAL